MDLPIIGNGIGEAIDGGIAVIPCARFMLQIINEGDGENDAEGDDPPAAHCCHFDNGFMLLGERKLGGTR